jgi:hypothetical protein
MKLNKMLGTSRVAAQLAASQEGLTSMYLLVVRPSPVVQRRGGSVSHAVCFSPLLNEKTNRTIIVCIYLSRNIICDAVELQSAS